jgi:peptidoglycan/xylan/chitin deacetylase (PgdA/CDA1 family)
VKAIFFLVTGFIDRTHAAWWDEVAWMVKASRRDLLRAGGWIRQPLPMDERSRPLTTRRLVARGMDVAADRMEAFLDHLAEITGSGRRDPAAAAADWITWDMARSIVRAGMTIGGHSVSHPVLARLPPGEQQAEIEPCLLRLEQELGIRPDLFAYPYGDRGYFDGQTKGLLIRSGVRMAFSNYGGVLRPASADRLDIPRTPLGPGSFRRFRTMATLPTLRPFVRQTRRLLVGRLPGRLSPVAQCGDCGDGPDAFLEAHSTP